jgi:phospholipase C
MRAPAPAAAAVLALSALASLTSAQTEAERLAAIEQLHATIHTLPAAEAARRFARLPRRSSPPPRQDKIDHFVVLFMENQAFLRTLGCLDLPGLDGVPAGGMLLKNGSGTPVNVTCGQFSHYPTPYVCDHGPSFSFLDAFFDEGADGSSYPYPPQTLENAVRTGASGRSVEMFSAEQLPIKAALAKSFGVFNKLYTASPTMSWPNHVGHSTRLPMMHLACTGGGVGPERAN